MSINVTVVMIGDEAIFAARRDPQSLEDLLNATVPVHGADCCDLVDVWRGVDRLINQGRPALGILHGDVLFVEGLTDPAHAIFSTGTRRLSARLDKVAAAIEAGQPHAGLTAEEVEELLPYFDRFHAFVQEAVRRGRGLVFCRWEGM